jgi:hypothetical protein
MRVVVSTPSKEGSPQAIYMPYLNDSLCGGICVNICFFVLFGGEGATRGIAR